MGNYSKWQVILYTRLGKEEGSNFPTVPCHQSSWNESLIVSLRHHQPKQRTPHRHSKIHWCTLLFLWAMWLPETFQFQQFFSMVRFIHYVHSERKKKYLLAFSFANASQILITMNFLISFLISRKNSHSSKWD